MKSKINILSKYSGLILGLGALLIILPMWVWAQPADQPTGGNVEANFTSVKLPTGPKMTGSFGKFVGLAPATQGNMGGYAEARTICSNAYPDSHVCTAPEMINSIEHGVAGMPNVGFAWINNGPPSYVSDVSNDCAGWTSNNNNDNPPAFSVYGSVWIFGSKQSLITTCGQSMSVACCAY